MSKEFTLIGIDFGLKNIGLAVGQTLTNSASALKSIKYSQPFNWRDLDKVIKDWQPKLIILGLPLTEDGEKQTITKEVEKFANMLDERYSIKIKYTDERYSSLEAQSEFAESRALGLTKKKDAKNLDSVAAKNILQRWLNNPS